MKTTISTSTTSCWPHFAVLEFSKWENYLPRWDQFSFPNGGIYLGSTHNYPIMLRITLRVIWLHFKVSTTACPRFSDHWWRQEKPLRGREWWTFTPALFRLLRPSCFAANMATKFAHAFVQAELVEYVLLPHNNKVIMSRVMKINKGLIKNKMLLSNLIKRLPKCRKYFRERD